VATLRQVLGKRLPGYDPGESELEGRIARIIDAQGLPHATHQHRVSYGKRRYRIDLAWPDRKLYLEGNGFGFHMLATDLDRDARRQNELVLDGWAPIEITWRMTDAEIANTIRRFLTLHVPR
jgi:very-short-patch-repair endonuclease